MGIEAAPQRLAALIASVIALTASSVLVSSCGSSDQSAEAFDNVEISNAISGGSAVENASDALAAPAQPERIKIKIRTIEGGREQTAYLVDRLQDTTSEKVEDAVHESGYPCSSAKGFHQLEQNGELMQVYKIDCSEGSYQMTAMNGQTFFKPWTGNMFGSTE